MAERVAAGLRPHGQAVRLRADLDADNRAGRGVDRVDDVVEPARQPEPLAVGADIEARPVKDGLFAGLLDGERITDRRGRRLACPQERRGVRTAGPGDANDG